MKVSKQLTSIISLTVLLTGCNLAKVRPITKMPDGNEDRMLKETFSGKGRHRKYWIYKVTVVDTTFGNQSRFAFEGFQSEAKVGYFEFTRDKLKFNNSITRQDLETSAVASQGARELINEWDIKHSEYRLAEVDGYTINKEEENKYIKWIQKRYFTVDWSKADISEANTFPWADFLLDRSCWKKKASYVIDSSRTVTENYISFIVAVKYEKKSICPSENSFDLKRWNQINFVTTVHYKYSFKKVKNPALKDTSYTPYVYTGEQDPLLRKYGYFRTVRPTIAKDRRDKNIFYMQRWNPNKKHVFYFSKDYPDKYKDIAHGVICHTNKLLSRHKLNDYPLDGKCKEDGSVLPSRKETCSKGICFELRENTGQEFGDIRYSFFHMLQTDMPIVGYGPRDAHPATGEIIAGNVITSIHILDFYIKYLLQNPYKRDLKEYYNEKGELITDNKTKYDTSSLFIRMKQTLKENDPAQWTDTSKLVDKNSKIRPEFEQLVTQLTFGHPAFSWYTSSSIQNSKQNNKDYHFNIDLLKIFKVIPEKIGEEFQIITKHSQKELLRRLSHQRNTTIYPAEPVIAKLPSLLANGMKPEEIKRRILFSLMSHELGHVLGLRHNFYGSFDARHWHDKSEEDPFLLKTSSVMDYINIKEEASGPLRAFWGPYDEAALVYAYSGGKKDLSKDRNAHYLFCTDHHRYSNSLCNAFDHGETPSKVMMSLIENYEEKYFIRNLRLDRAYWDTSYYPVRIFMDMWDLKRTLLMWRTAFRHDYISKILSESKKQYTANEVNFISNQVQKDIRQAIKLNMAFYNSVIQLSSADRDWQTLFNEESGSIEKIGVFWDKLFSMYFLMGDDGFLYNPNHYLGKASYLTYTDDLGFRQMIEEIMENTLTQRVDMEPWFIDFGRFLYAKNASNYYNIVLNGALLEKIGVRCYTPKGLKDRFGIDSEAYQADEHISPDFLDTALVPMEDHIDKINDPYYRNTNETLGVTYFDGNYYVAASNLNKYSFTIIDRMRRVTHSDGDSLRLGKQDVYDVFFLYNYFKKNGVVPQNCDDGF